MRVILALRFVFSYTQMVIGISFRFNNKFEIKNQQSVVNC